MSEEKKEKVLTVEPSREKGKNLVSEFTTVVSEVNTSLSRASPRPGGYMKILPLKLSCKSDSSQSHQRTFDVDSLSACACESEVCAKLAPKGKKDPPMRDKEFISSHDTTRGFRIQAALDEWDASSIDTAEFVDTEIYEDGKDAAVGPDENIARKAPINLASILVSTVMLLASGNTIGKETIKTMVAYLSCIKDEDGVCPPNVQGLLNYIHLQYGFEAKRNKPAKHLSRTDVSVYTTVRLKDNKTIKGQSA